MPQIVLVTGGAAGIGLATAQAFAAAGDVVILADLDADRAEAAVAALGSGHLALALDVADEGSVQAAVAAALARFGRIDVLVNNAGVIDPAAHPALTVPDDVLARLIAVNLRGPMLMAREAGRAMLAAGGGAIINIASGAALRALPGRAAYGATKAALLGLTRAMACEWAGRGVRVNAVLPGYVETEILASLRRAGRFDAAAVERAIPLGRLAAPAEIAAVVAQVARATYMAGASIVVDGGVDAFGGSGAASTDIAPVAPPGGTVLVTGGAAGIGAAIADRFVAAGAVVAVIDRDCDAVARLALDRAGWIADVTDRDAVGAVLAQIGERLGPIGTLVNNAAVADPGGPTAEQPIDQFDRVIAIDLAAPFALSQQVAAGMRARGGGTIVNLSSIAATGGLPERGGYCAAKAGLSFATRAMACEWAAYGIRVNAVAPGYVATPAVAALAAEGRRDLEAVRARVPMGRLGMPAEIADAVHFLASPAASYVTGAVWAVDGGWGAFGDAGPAYRV